jgi:hypothetical protein
MMHKDKILKILNKSKDKLDKFKNLLQTITTCNKIFKKVIEKEKIILPSSIN